MSRPLQVGVALVIGLASGIRLDGQVVQLRRGVGQIAYEFQGLWTRFGAGPGDLSGGHIEQLRMSFTGSLLDPEFLSFNAQFKPSLSQRISSNPNGGAHLRQLDFEVGARLLAERPVTFQASAARAHRVNSGTFGTFSNFTTVNSFAGMSLQLRPFPMSLSYANRATDNTWHSPTDPDPIVRHDNLRTLRFAGRSTKSSLAIESVTFEDHVTGTGFAALRTDASHILRWGKGSRLATTFSKSQRGSNDNDSPVAPANRMLWSEALHLQHTRDIATDWFYRRTFTDLDQSHSRSTELAFSTGYRIATLLDLRLVTSRRVVTFDQGGERSFQIVPSASFVAFLPLGSMIRASGSIGVQNRSPTGDAAELPVLNESHRIPPGRDVYLNRERVILSSIEVLNEDRSFTYSEGVDYTVEVINGLTRILIPPTSRIQVNQRILINYRYTQPTIERRRNRTSNYNVQLRLGSVLTISHQQSVRSSRIDEAGGLALTALDESSNQTTRITGAIRSSLGRIRIQGSRRIHESATTHLTTYEIGTSASLNTSSRTQLAASGNWKLSRTDGIAVTTKSLSAVLNWVLSRELETRWKLESYELNRDQADDGERFIASQFNLVWQPGRTRLVFGYQRHWRWTSAFGGSQRLTIRVERNI